MLLSELIASSAERHPDKTALITAGQNISFRDLDAHSNCVASRLRKLGIGRGARAAILHENSLEAVICFWGVLKSGTQVVDVPLGAGVRSIGEILAEARPAALFASKRQLQRLMSPPSNLPPVVIVSGGTCPEVPGHQCCSLSEIRATEDSVGVLRTEAHECDVALIIYTSGTTGSPKGVMLSHRNLLSNIRASNSLMGLTSEDSILMVVPLHFIHGRMQLLTHALIGGTIAFSEGFQFPQQVIEELLKYRVTGFSGVPYHFSTLLEMTNLSTTALPDLKYVIVTGGALPPERLLQLSRALPDVEIHIAYGQTEASPRITHLPPALVLSNPESSGKPLPGVHVELVADDGSPTPPGGIGEIAVSGPNVMHGYVSGDEVTSNKIDDFGRLRTGDLGRFDADGCLYLVGRKSDLIKCAGERVFPREIEAVLGAHPAVLECAVLGIPDALLGERIVACVVLQPECNSAYEDLRTYCLKSLPVVRIPREIRFSAGLPKTSSGKIDRGKLATHFQANPTVRTSAA